MTMLDDATGAKAAELAALVTERSGLTVSTQRLSAIAADSSIEAEESASSAATASIATTTLSDASFVTIKNDQSKFGSATCVTTLGGLAPPGLPCAFPKVFDGVVHQEESGCLPGAYPFAPSSWTNEHAGFCFTSQGVWGNCECTVAAVVAHQAALQGEFI